MKVAVNIIDERHYGVDHADEVDEMVVVCITPDLEMGDEATPDHFLHYDFQTPADLAGHPCIAYQFADGSLYQWELWQEGKSIKHRPQGQWVFSDSYMEAAAAKMGLGLAYVPEKLVSDELERGSLIQVLNPIVTSH